MLDRIAAGRTDLVVDHLAAGGDPHARDTRGVSLIQWCAYHGDVAAIRVLAATGVPLSDMGANLDLNGAAFHGYPKLVEYLIEHGADPNYPLPDTAETPLHAALCKTDRPEFDDIVALLLKAGADPNRTTKPGVETDAFMRDIRTRGETPLHRAAAFGSEGVITLLIEAGAKRDVRDANGDSPLTWASWHLRPRAILRLLCFGPFRVGPGS